MALIRAYTFTPEDRDLQPKVLGRGYDPKKKAFKPLRYAKPVKPLHLYLDSITAAVEAGLVDSEKWPAQLFATPEDLSSFLDELSRYDSYYRINDRCYEALFRLAAVRDEAGFVTAEEIADTLAERADELLAAAA